MMYVNSGLPKVEAPTVPPPPKADIKIDNPTKFPELTDKKDLIGTWFSSTDLKFELLFSLSKHSLTCAGFHRRLDGK